MLSYGGIINISGFFLENTSIFLENLAFFHILSDNNCETGLVSLKVTAFKNITIFENNTNNYYGLIFASYEKLNAFLDKISFVLCKTSKNLYIIFYIGSNYL